MFPSSERKKRDHRHRISALRSWLSGREKASKLSNDNDVDMRDKNVLYWVRNLLTDTFGGLLGEPDIVSSALAGGGEAGDEGEWEETADLLLIPPLNVDEESAPPLPLHRGNTSSAVHSLLGIRNEATQEVVFLQTSGHQQSF